MAAEHEFDLIPPGTIAAGRATDAYFDRTVETGAGIVLIDGAVVVSVGATVRAFEADSGERRWQYETESGDPVAQVPLTTDGRAVYAVTGGEPRTIELPFPLRTDGEGPLLLEGGGRYELQLSLAPDGVHVQRTGV